MRRAGATSTLTLSPVSFENENSYLCSVTCARRKLEKEIQVEVYCKCFSKWMTHWLLPLPFVPLEEKGCDCVRKSICVERDLASLDLWTLLDAIQLVQLSGIYRICLQHAHTAWLVLLSSRTWACPMLCFPHCHMYVVHGGGEWEQLGPCVHSDKDSVRVTASSTQTGGETPACLLFCFALRWWGGNAGLYVRQANAPPLSYSFSLPAHCVLCFAFHEHFKQSLFLFHFWKITLLCVIFIIFNRLENNWSLGLAHIQPPVIVSHPFSSHPLSPFPSQIARLLIRYSILFIVHI